MHDSLFGSELSAVAVPPPSSAVASVINGANAPFDVAELLDSGLTGDSFAPTPPFNFRLLLVFASFLVPYLAFLLILPGVREKRLASFVAITVQIGVGLLLMASLILPYWKVGEVTMVSQFYSHSRLMHEAHLSVNVGLEHINITLNYAGTQNSAEMPFRGLSLNERYHMSGVGVMSEELRAAYRRGLPYPLLKVMEYFSLSQGAFAWGRLYRNAGYYTNAVLWLAFACWALQCVMLALVPHHYSKTGILCGILALISNFVYIGNTPSSDVKIPFESRNGETIFLLLRYGSCIYMSFFAGLIATAFGFVLSLLQFMRLYSISTCLSGYLDDTVGPKCKWSHNIKPGDRRVLPIEMQSVKKQVNVANGWTTANSSITASTAASSTSSTNGDNTETYITDETASAGDSTPAHLRVTKHSPSNDEHTNRQRLMPDSPNSGLAVSQSRAKATANDLSPIASELYKRRQSNGGQIWAAPALELPSSANCSHDRLLSGEASTRSGSTLITFVNTPPLLSNALTPHSALTPMKSHSPMRGESSGFQSSRSSFSDCSLAGDDDEDVTTCRNSLATGTAFFRFTDDEDDGHAKKDVSRKEKHQLAENKTPKRSLFRVSPQS